MSNKVNQSLVRPAVSRGATEPAPTRSASSSRAPAALSERSLKKSGKVSSFTGTNAPLQPKQRALASSAPTFKAGSLHAGLGGQLAFADAAKAEAAVDANAARTDERSIAQIKKNPDAFLKNVTQLDGVRESTIDQSSCGPTSLLMGMIAARPESIQELGKKLVDESGEPTKAGRALLGSDIDDGAVKASLYSLRSGRFSPADVTLLSMVLQHSTGKAGSSAEDLMALRDGIDRLGVDVPKMELQQFGDLNGGQGHWRVNVGGKQYNPWPDENGQSSVVKGGLKAGARDGQGWTCREKVALQDGVMTHSYYAASSTSGQKWEVHDDPPLMFAQYTRGSGGGLERSKVDASRLEGQLGSKLQARDLDSIATSSIRAWKRD